MIGWSNNEKKYICLPWPVLKLGGVRTRWVAPIQDIKWGVAYGSRFIMGLCKLNTKVVVGDLVDPEQVINISFSL